MRKYFACSVGKPGDDYDEENLERIITNRAFIMHRDTTQKGVYENINAGDILLLKYRNNFVAYGETTGKQTITNSDWNIAAPVVNWYFNDINDTALGVETYGIQWNTLEGAGQMGTVKEIDESFCIEKIKRIDSQSDLFKSVISEILKRKNMEDIKELIKLLDHKKQIILQGPPGTGKTFTAKDIAEEMIFGKVSVDKKLQLENLESSHQFKFIQFHPAYSYEDFVRGITVESRGNSIFYEAKNKIIGKIAAEAYKNHIESNKDVNTLSKEKWVEGMFEEFKDSLQTVIEDEEKITLTKSAHVYEIDQTAFKYTGANWNTDFRMPFRDIIKLFLLKVNERREIKKQTEVSGRAKQHATYYFQMLAQFKEFMKNKYFNEENSHEITEKKYILIIDEINRANLSAVLGDLIYGLEYRGAVVESMYSTEEEGNEIVLPPNLYIIGTMNTADRSVGHIDYAIRRRFAFVDILPSSSPIDDVIKDPILNEKAKLLFEKVSELFYEKQNDLDGHIVYLQADFKKNEVQLGHSYFLADKEETLKLKLEFEIKPILYEYIKDGLLSEDARGEIKNLAVQ